MTVAILCARRDSVYKSFGDCDVYDADRDAFSFAGGSPVVAHPPCRGWGRFAWRSNHTERELELGRFCLQAVQQNGGVLEHPAGSRLFDGIPRPGQGPRRRTGFLLSLDQGWFGHAARKNTWVYVVGILPTSLPAMSYSLHRPWRSVVDQSRADRERTPFDFALWLVTTARLCQPQRGEYSNIA